MYFESIRHVFLYCCHSTHLNLAFEYSESFHWKTPFGQTSSCAPREVDVAPNAGICVSPPYVVIVMGPNCNENVCTKHKTRKQVENIMCM